MKIAIFILFIASSLNAQYRLTTGLSSTIPIRLAQSFTINTNNIQPNLEIGISNKVLDFTLSIGGTTRFKATHITKNVYFGVSYSWGVSKAIQSEYIEHGPGMNVGYNKFFNNNRNRFFIGASLGFVYVSENETHLIIEPIQVGFTTRI